jgi:type I restriction enzyme M protein
MAIDTNKLQQQAADLSSQLWGIANDLRGGMDANEFRNYILGTIFYRYLSERTEMYMQDILKDDGLTYEQVMHKFFSSQLAEPDIPAHRVLFLGVGEPDW